MIKKLGLKFPKQRSNKRYGSVPFSYGTEVVAAAPETNEMTKCEVSTSGGVKLRSYDPETLRKMNQRKRVSSNFFLIVTAVNSVASCLSSIF